MLILTRKAGERLYIGENVKVTIVEIKGNQIRVGIDAPPDLRIYREEIYLQIMEENRKAAETSLLDSDGLEELIHSWKRPEIPHGKDRPSNTDSAKGDRRSGLSAASLVSSSVKSLNNNSLENSQNNSTPDLESSISKVRNEERKQ